MSGRLILAGTPIGNLQDASPRLIAALATADVIAAEDTRKLQRLLAGLEVQSNARIVSYYDAVEAERVPQLLNALADGKTVVVVSDAGMPTVSDPGFRIAAAAVEAGHHVTALPGPSAVLMALALSGLPSDRFCFEGFLPRKAGERTRALQLLAREMRTMIFFEAPHRISDTINAMSEVFGADRPAALCRELTKTYEEAIRGSLAELAKRCESEVLGEITIVVQGAPAQAEATDAELTSALQQRLAAGLDRKSAIADVTTEYGVAKRRVFDLAAGLKAANSGAKPA